MYLDSLQRILASANFDKIFYSITRNRLSNKMLPSYMLPS